MNLDQGGFGSRHTEILAAPPDLVELVESSFIRYDALVRPSGRGWRGVPDCSANVVIVLRATASGNRAEAGVVGARSSFADVDVSNRRITIGVRLRPGALSALTRERASAFTDRAFPLADAFGSSWRGLADGLEERDPRAVLQDVLRLLRGSPRARASPLIAAARQASSVAELARALAMPVRTLHERTLETMGLSPKRLLRILRLHRALETYRPSLGWASTAASTGFADQAHLVREARGLLGEPPSRWLERGRHPNRPANTALPIRSRRASACMPTHEA